MIIVGIDYGDARTGIAVCDKNEIIASPVKSVKSYNADKAANEICDIFKELNAEYFVMGLPKNMDGTEGDRAKKCRDFASELSELSGLKYSMCDERLTTVFAHNVLNVTNTRGDKRKAVVDQVSAVVILQDYIDSKKGKI